MSCGAELDTGSRHVRPKQNVSSHFLGGEGEPLVLLHGAMMSWRIWRPVLPGLMYRHRVFAPTLAGHHGARRLHDVPRDRIVDGMVDRLCDQLDELEFETAHLVGNSLGGWAALELARRGRARSVVAISPAGAWQLPGDLDRLLRLFRKAQLTGGWKTTLWLSEIPWLRRWLFATLCRRGELIPPGAIAEVFADGSNCSVLAEMLDGAAEAGPMAPLTAPLPCPVRIAWAEKDRTLPYPRYGRPLLAAVPGAELVVMPGVGHVPMYDDPDLVARTILDVTTGRPGADVV